MINGDEQRTMKRIGKVITYTDHGTSISIGNRVVQADDTSREVFDKQSQLGKGRKRNKQSLIKDNETDYIMEAPKRKGVPGAAKPRYMGKRGSEVSRHEKALIRATSMVHGDKRIRAMSYNSVASIYKFWYSHELISRDAEWARKKKHGQSVPHPGNRQPVSNEDDFEEVLLFLTRGINHLHNLSKEDIIPAVRKLLNQPLPALPESHIVVSARQRQNKSLNGSNGSVTNTDDHKGLTAAAAFKQRKERRGRDFNEEVQMIEAAREEAAEIFANRRQLTEAEIAVMDMGFFQEVEANTWQPFVRISPVTVDVKEDSREVVEDRVEGYHYPEFVYGGKRGFRTYKKKVEDAKAGVPFFVDGARPGDFSGETLREIPQFSSVHGMDGIFQGQYFDHSSNPDRIRTLVDVRGREWALLRNSEKVLKHFINSAADGTGTTGPPPKGGLKAERVVEDVNNRFAVLSDDEEDEPVDEELSAMSCTSYSSDGSAMSISDCENVSSSSDSSTVEGHDFEDFPEDPYPDITEDERPSEHNQVILTDGVYLEHLGKGFMRKGETFIPCESGGKALPEYISIQYNEQAWIRGDAITGSLITPGPGAVHHMRSPTFLTHNVYNAARFTWFRKLRESASDYTRLATFGTLYKRTIFRQFAKDYRKLCVHRAALDMLRTEKIASAISDQNNKLFLKQIRGVYNTVPIDILIDTVIYFTESRAIAHVKVNATNEACAHYVKQPKHHVPPTQYGSSLADIKTSREAGFSVFTTEEESIEGFASGNTCCQQKEYVDCDPSHLNKEIPYEMYECVEDQDICKRRGCYLDNTGIHCRTDFSCETPYQTLGTHFQTNSEVINHKKISQVEASFNRILQPVAEAVSKRAYATAMGMQTLNYLRGMQAVDEPLEELTRAIRRFDRDYDEGFLAYNEFVENHGEVNLTENDKNLCFARALVKNVRSTFEMFHEPDRVHDEVAEVLRYTEEIGSKVGERKAYVDDFKEGTASNKSYLAVQMKPHEAQKYKKGKLKFGRLVISIVGQGWIDANPSLLCDGKSALQALLHVKVRDGTCTVTIDKSGENAQVVAGHAHMPYVCDDSDFYHRSMLTETSNDELAAQVGIYDGMMEGTLVRTSCCLSHGDDMLMVSNRDHDVVHGRRSYQWYELDIADNDSSHVDIDMRLEYLALGRRNERVREVFKQMALPIVFVNPAERKEYIRLRYKHGMRMVSGSVATTYINSAKSLDLMLATHFLRHSAEDSCLSQGFVVTSKIGTLEDVSFLSRYYTSAGGRVKAYYDVACWMRKFGKITGDAPGSSKTPVHKRIIEHSRGVSHQMATLSESKIAALLDAKYAKTRLGKLGMAQFFVMQRKLNEEDMALIRYYYGEAGIQQGIEEYCSTLEVIRNSPRYGAVIMTAFIDRAMLVKYGMSGVC